MKDLLVTAALGVVALLGNLNDKPKLKAGDDPSNSPYVLVADPIECFVGDEPLGDPLSPQVAPDQQGPSVVDDDPLKKLLEVAEQLQRDAEKLKKRSEDLELEEPQALKFSFQEDRLAAIESKLDQLIETVERVARAVNSERGPVFVPGLVPQEQAAQSQPDDSPIAKANPYAGYKIIMHTGIYNGKCYWCDLFMKDDAPKLKAEGITVVEVKDVQPGQNIPQIELISPQGTSLWRKIGRIEAAKILEDLK